MDFLEMVMKKNPSMRHILITERKKREARLAEAKDHLGEIQEALGLGNGNLSDDDLIEAAEAVKLTNKKADACKNCQYTVENCDTCKYTKIAVRENRYLRDEYFFPCRKYRMHRKLWEISKMMNASGLGERFKQRRFDTFKPDSDTVVAKREAEQFCAALQSNPKATGLMLVGPYGCGKTHLAAAILYRCAELGVAGMFVVVPELLARIRKSYRTGDGKAEEVIDAAKNAKLLILDDLGAEKASEWVKEQLYMLINYRYEHMLPIVITTNNSGAELDKELGRRTLSRLVEMTKPVKIQAGDYRMKLAAR